MMPNTERRFGDIELEYDHTAEDAPSAALTMLAFCLSRLSESECEDRLLAIEQGALRQAVARFAARRLSSPYPRVGNGRTAH
jgi:hypothetical protein